MRPPTPPPTFAGRSIRAVTIETGIGAMVLRDWERRFGFPAPERRPGSDRRIYSAADVARLKLIKGALDVGYRIGDVVDRPNEELEGIVHRPAESLGPPAPPGDAGLDPEPFVKLLAAERVDDLEAQIRRVKATYDAKRFVTAFAHPLVVAIGCAWEEARIGVRHEHLASEALTTVMRQMLAEVQPTGTSPTILLATLPGDVYTLPLLFVSLYLAASGAKVRMLGGRTPADELVKAAAAMKVEVVGIPISEDVAPDVGRRALRRIRSALPPEVCLWVGGLGAPALGLEPRVARTLLAWPEIDAALDEARKERLALLQRHRAGAFATAPTKGR